MKSYRKELVFEAPKRRAFINITDKVQACLRESGIGKGCCCATPCTSLPKRLYQRR